MRMRRQWLRLVMFVSVTAMLATPAIASEESPAARPEGSDDTFCIYQGRGDTPEIGPLPCDTSRPYMIGRSGFSRSPSSEPVDGTSASPPMADGNPNPLIDSQAP